MQIDHIDPKGGDTLDNLCLSCWNCNSSKHKATTVIDPESGERVPLFNPRLRRWSDHFSWIDGGAQIEGLTAVGRVTILRLKMNRPVIVAARQRWVDGGHHPPR